MKTQPTPAAEPTASELNTHEGEAYDIPERGSLGLLALGYAGLMMWRHRRAELQQARMAAQNTKTAPTSND